MNKLSNFRVGCIFDQITCGVLGAGAFFLTQNITLEASAFSMYHISEKSRISKIRDRDLDFHRDVRSR